MRPASAPFGWLIAEGSRQVIEVQSWLGATKLANVEVVVLDEADEMLNAGFEEDVELLLAATPAERQTMLFSATLPRWAENLAAQHLREPLRANVVQGESVSYREVVLEAPLSARLNILSDLLYVYGQGHTIVFTRTKAEVDDLARTLSAQGHAAEAVHGEALRPGHVHLAPGNRHLTVSKREGAVSIALTDDPPENFCRPAVDPMLTIRPSPLARSAGSSAWVTRIRPSTLTSYIAAHCPGSDVSSGPEPKAPPRRTPCRPSKLGRASRQISQRLPSMSNNPQSFGIRLPPGWEDMRSTLP